MPFPVAPGRLGAALLTCAVMCAALVADAQARVPRTWPFAPPLGLRHARSGVPSLWNDGQPCSTGCRAPGAIAGWPVRPFHRQHRLRAGLNELRRVNLHVGVDILARDGTRAYAMQAGRARILAARGVDARVQVGQFIYWHIRPRVREGQFVRPYDTVVGTVLRGAGHLHLSEVRGGRYLNPLRPGGRVLAPWRDRGRPVLGRPIFRSGGRVLLKGFDPLTSRRRGSRTPVLGLAGLAYRLRDDRGRRLGPLHWALRGSQHLADRLRSAIYARGSHAAGAQCAGARRHPCRPNWVYRLAGGLAPRLRVRERRVYTLTAYGWDWAGHVSALDTRVIFVRGEPFVSTRP
jgi:hypothetical protein